MNPFSESDLAELRARFPQRDVDRIARAVAQRHEKQRFRNPVAMLARWCQTAEEKDTDRLAQQELYPRSDWTPTPMGERSDPGYAAFRFGLMQRVLTEGLGPLDVADILAEYVPNFEHLPGLGELLDREIALFRSMENNRWQHVVWETWSVLDGPAAERQSLDKSIPFSEIGGAA